MEAEGPAGKLLPPTLPWTPPASFSTWRGASLTFCAHVAGECLSQLRKTAVTSRVPGSARRPSPAPPDTQRPTGATPGPPTDEGIHRMWYTQTVGQEDAPTPARLG